MSLALTLHYAAQGIHIASQNGARTKYSIIWNCLAVIFSCTWLAIHPNIPGPNVSRWVIFLRRARLIFVAMVAPEAVMMWAMKQWIAAYKLGRKYKSPYGWTQRHGYFAIMGGFSVYGDDNELHTVTPTELDELLKNGEIKITEEEIRSKGKGDALSTAAILIQMIWFILQCISRKVEGLPSTELELVTLGFAALNIVTYVVWWNKPLNVKCAISIFRKGKGGGEVGVTGAGGTGNTPAECAANSTTGIATLIGPVYNTSGWICKMPGAIVHALQCYLCDYGWQVILGHPLALFLFPFLLLSHTSTRMIAGNVVAFPPFFKEVNDRMIKGKAKRVPTFYSGPLSATEETLAGSAVMMIAAIFGAIHCIGWSFEFPSHTEQVLWRLASIAITLSPLPLLMLALVGHLDRRSVINAPIWVVICGIVITWPCIPVYIIGRLVLLVLPFMSL